MTLAQVCTTLAAALSIAAVLMALSLLREARAMRREELERYEAELRADTARSPEEWRS